MSSICIGLIIGSTISYICNKIFSTEVFDQWAWRIPFLLSIFGLVLVYSIQNHTKETEIFQNLKSDNKISTSPIKTLVQNNWKDLIISILINSTGSVLFYMNSVYIMNYLKIYRQFKPEYIDILMILSYLQISFFSLFFGYLSDRISRKKIYIINIIFMILSIKFLLDTITNSNLIGIALAQYVLSLIIAAYLGPEPSLQVRLYPNHIRNSGLSISYNISTTIFGGLTPFIVQIIMNKFNNIAISGYYLMFCGILSLITIVTCKKF